LDAGEREKGELGAGKSVCCLGGGGGAYM
jgi:hypothetical protein